MKDYHLTCRRSTLNGGMFVWGTISRNGVVVNMETMMVSPLTNTALDRSTSLCVTVLFSCPSSLWRNTLWSNKFTN